MDIDTLVNSKEAKLYLLLLIIVGITLLMVAADYKEFTGSNVNHLALD